MATPQAPQDAPSSDAQPEIPPDALPDLAYVLACFTTARDELMFRVKHRDNWIQLELLAQGVLLALAQGIQLGGVSAARPSPDVLGLSSAIALVLACLYYMEDNHVGYLSKYAGAISRAEAIISKRRWIIANWDISEQLRHYSHRVLPMRLVAQIIAFIVIPGGLSLLWVSRAVQGSLLQYSELVLDGVFLSLITVFTFRAYRLRRRTGEVAPMSLLLPPNSIGQARPEDTRKTATRFHAAKGYVALLWVALVLGILLDAIAIITR